MRVCTVYTQTKIVFVIEILETMKEIQKIQTECRHRITEKLPMITMDWQKRDFVLCLTRVSARWSCLLHIRKLIQMIKGACVRAKKGTPKDVGFRLFQEKYLNFLLLPFCRSYEKPFDSL